MIKTTDKHNCCGCEACVQRCPKQCISFLEDEEGFSYPEIDISICIDCGLCEKVCPVLNQSDTHTPIQAYAAINQDEAVRAQSSSGGIFTSIAEKVISTGGVVFGARFNDNWEVEHCCINREEDLKNIRGSKYVQSRIGTAYQEVENFLKEDRKVLFSGTSCQVAGLKKFLRKEYDELITVDVVCHGVPSPKLWKEYLATLKHVSPIKSVNMKDKTEGWKGYKLTIQGEKETFSERTAINKYMLAFSQNLSLRPSCYQCPAKAGRCGSDITLGDYWGVEKLIPTMYDNKGTSFVCANTQKGSVILETLPIEKKIADYDASIPYNACIVASTSEPLCRTDFWKRYNECGVKVLQALSPQPTNIIKRTLRWLERKLK